MLETDLNQFIEEYFILCMKMVLDQVLNLENQLQ